MNNKRYILLLVLALFSLINLKGQSIVIRKVCRNVNDNQILWSRKPNSCTITGNLTLYGRESSVSPFNEISNIINPNNFLFSHLAANLPTNKNWEYYFKWNEDCGSGVVESFSDTMGIDEEQPEPSNIDSVSVDPITNKVIIGWRGNKSLDFSSYSLYNYNRADPRVVENYKDTNYIDVSSGDPTKTKLRYELTSVDSCGNRNPLSGNIHQTILLTNTFDTCKKEVQLTWSKYEGWNHIDKIYIFEIIGTTFYLIDSLDGAAESYQISNIPRGTKKKYFVRAANIKGTATSSSNSITTIEYLRYPPGKDYIATVSRETQGIKVQIEPAKEASNQKTILKRTTITASKEFQINTKTYIDKEIFEKEIYKYQVFNYGLCPLEVDSSNISNNIVLTIQVNETNRLLWNRYFTWNNGVENYIIYRATGTNESEAQNFVEWKYTFDTTEVDIINPEVTTCYKIVAKERGTPYQSESNTICFKVIGNIFWPNSIAPYGINNKFKPIGLGIELNESKIQIFNRWGNLIFETSTGNLEWDGRDFEGNIAKPDVYIFTAIIKQGNSMNQYHGSIQIIY